MKIEFTEHALVRARQRLSLGLRAIACEIADAIEAGRVSKTAPTWMIGDDYTLKRGVEFAWSPKRERVYVLARRESDFAALVTILRGVRAVRRAA